MKGELLICVFVWEVLWVSSFNVDSRTKREEDETLSDLFKELFGESSNEDQSSLTTTKTTTLKFTLPEDDESLPNSTYSTTTPEFTNETDVMLTLENTTSSTTLSTPGVINLDVKQSDKVSSSSVRTSTASGQGSTTTSSTRRTTTSNQELAKMFGFTSPASSTTIAACDTEEKLDTFCDLTSLPELIHDINIWDVYYTIFSDSIIESLLLNCASGSWCLHNEFNAYQATMIEKAEMVRTSDAFGAMCEQGARECIGSVARKFGGCSVGPRLNFTEDAVDLLCRLRASGDVDITCFQQTIISFHVYVMDIVRDENKVESESIEEEEEVCSTTEAKMIRTYLCNTFRCPSHTAEFQSFRPWKWFADDVDRLKEACFYGNNTCADEEKETSTTTLSSVLGEIDSGGIIPPTIRTLPPPPSDTENSQQYQDGELWMNVSDLKLMAAISVGTLVIVICVVITTFVCLKKYRASSAGKRGYKPLSSHDP